MRARPGKHRFVWLEHDGKFVVWTERSNGRGDLGRVEFAIRKQLKVNEQQMRDLINCPMTRDAYLALLKEKSVL